MYMSRRYCNIAQIKHHNDWKFLVSMECARTFVKQRFVYGGVLGGVRLPTPAAEGATATLRAQAEHLPLRHARCQRLGSREHLRAIWCKISAKVPECTSTNIGTREEQTAGRLDERVIVLFVLHPANT